VYKQTTATDDIARTTRHAERYELAEPKTPAHDNGFADYEERSQKYFYSRRRESSQPESADTNVESQTCPSVARSRTTDFASVLFCLCDGGN
jgi:hypothetical protein